METAYIVIVSLLSLIIILLLRLKGYFYFVKEPNSAMCFESVNNSTENANVVLFGLNSELLKPNYGSEKGITICPLPKNIAYLELLQRSGNNPFTTREVNIRGKLREIYNLVLYVETKDANAQKHTIPIFVNSYIEKEHGKVIYDTNGLGFKGEYTEEELNSDVEVIIPYPIKINANTLVSFLMKPSSKIEWRIFYQTKEICYATVFKYLFY